MYGSTRNGRPPLIDQLARKLVSVWGGVSVALVHAQLARNNPWFKRVPTPVIEQRLENAEWARVKDHKVSTSGIAVLNPRNELDGREYRVWLGNQNKHWPSGVDDIAEYTEGFSATRRKDFESMARVSVIFTKIDGLTTVLRNNDLLLRAILESAPFVDPVVRHGANSNADTKDDSQPVEVHGFTQTGNPTSPGGAVADHQSGLLVGSTSLVDSDADDSNDIALDPMHLETLEDVKFGRTTTSTRTVRHLLEQIAEGTLVIPGIQRGYVWKTAQVRDLLDSLYRGYPVGTMLVWDTDQHLSVRSLGTTEWKNRKTNPTQSLLLDGQQRLTSLYLAIVTGQLNLYFNALSGGGSFAFTSARRSYSVRSIPVRGLLHESVDSVLRRCNYAQSKPDYSVIRARIQRLLDVLDRVVSVDTLHDFDYQEVTSVFIRVNSRGTKLKAAELAIAEVAYRLPDLVTSEISLLVDDLARRGWNFTVAFFIRLIAAEGTGRVAYSGLNLMDDHAIEDSFARVKTATLVWLDYLRDSLQLVSEEVLAGINPHIVPIVWLARHNAPEVHHRFGYWFALASAFSRYSGTTDTNLDQDLRSLSESDPVAFVETLLPPLQARRSTLRIEPLDIERAGQQSALLLLMYLAELNHARSSLLGDQHRLHLSSQQPDLIAPIQIVSNPRLKAVGYGADSSRPKNGGLANVVFVSSVFAEGEHRSDILTQLKNVGIEARYQHALPVPPNQETFEAINSFLNARVRLLADHFNDALNLLQIGHLQLRAVSDRLPADSPRRASAAEFDGVRRRMYEEIRRKLYDLVPGMREKETSVYRGFQLTREGRPFATVSKRKKVLNFTVDAELDELNDPRGWCRDMSTTSKHGIGNTSFVVTQPDQVDYAMNLLEQVIERRSQ